jgi:hypothetical protein
MFRKFLIFAMFATAAGYCFADSYLPQVTTSEVFVNGDMTEYRGARDEVRDVESQYGVAEYGNVPAWPIAGSDADVTVKCDDKPGAKNSDNIRIVSKIGDDMIVDNTFDFNGTGWTGGANMLHGAQIPMGFDDECENGAEMPLLRRDMLEDDGGNVLAVSRSGRKNCTKRNGVADAVFMEMDSDADIAEIGVKADAEAPKSQPDQVRSWVVANGQTLREVLQNWCDKEGWDLVWATSREYPIEASAVFKGRFTDVASALVRNFGRATPVPYAKFYKGNLVLVISTNED